MRRSHARRNRDPRRSIRRDPVAGGLFSGHAYRHHRTVTFDSTRSVWRSRFVRFSQLCESARGLDADRLVNSLILKVGVGTNCYADSQQRLAGRSSDATSVILRTTGIRGVLRFSQLCESARGLDADRLVNSLILKVGVGTNCYADSQQRLAGRSSDATSVILRTTGIRGVLLRFRLEYAQSN